MKTWAKRSCESAQRPAFAGQDSILRCPVKRGVTARGRLSIIALGVFISSRLEGLLWRKKKRALCGTSSYRANTGTYEVTVFDEKDNHTETPTAWRSAAASRALSTTSSMKTGSGSSWSGGDTYDIRLKGIGAGVRTDTVLRIYNSEGEEVGFHDDVDYAAGQVRSRLEFSPDVTGTYYISAGAYTGNPIQDNSGPYQVVVYGADAADTLVLTGTARSDYYLHNRLTGSLGDDMLAGKSGWDWLEGGAGADVLIGGTGEDTASYQYSDADVEVRLDDGTAKGGDAEGDTFPGRKTIEYVQGGEKPQNSEVPEFEEFVISIVFGVEEDEEAEEIEILDIEDLVGSAHDDILVGTYGANWLTGYYGNDVLDGKEGNDGLIGGGGADALIGGPGIDFASYFDSNEGVEVDLHNGVGRGGFAEGDTFPGRQIIEYTDRAGETREIEVSDIENLYGSYFHGDILIGNHNSNRIIGFKGDDELDGRGGHDLLEGREGADALRGGEGNDLASYAHSDEAVEVRLHDGTARGGDAEGDTFTGMKTVEYSTPAGDTVEMEVPDVEDLIGSAHDDILVGAHGPNRLGGYRGDDELDGREGDDWLDGGPGADMLRGGEGNDTASYFFSFTGGVVVRLHNGTARGGEAEGDIFAGTDVVEYTDSEGNILTMEVPDIENLDGSSFPDILAGDLRDNRINGGGGDDEIYGGPGGGDDLLMGGAGDDRIYGGIGNDTLEGGPGNDQLRGGPDDDMLDGGEGDDAFIIAAGGGNDTILDFGNGADIVDLAAFEDIRSTDDLIMLQQDGNLVIDLTGMGGGTVTLLEVNETDIMGAHFAFFMDDASAMA